MIHVLMWLMGCTQPEQSYDSADIGFDTADPYVRIDSCDLSGLEVLDLGSAKGLGEFVVLPTNTGLLIEASEKVLFEGVGNWLAVTLAERVVDEYQGSFSFDYIDQLNCVAPQTEEVSSSASTMLIEGGFTDDGCDDITFLMQLCPSTANRLFFDIEIAAPETGHSEEYRVVLNQVSTPDEKFLGLGEQFPHSKLNLKGRTIPVLAEEGGVGRGHPEITPFINQFFNGSGGDENSTYFPMPFYMTDLSVGFFLHNTELSEFSFQEGQTSVAVDSTTVNGEFVNGDSPLDVLTSFTEYAGRMPAPPEWIDNGAIIALARPLDEGRIYIDDLLNNGVQIAGVWNQTWSGVNRTFIGEQVLWNWVQGSYDHPNWNAWVDGLNEDGIEVLCYVNSMFLDVTGHESQPSRNLYLEGAQGGYFVEDEAGEILKLPVTAFDVALLDLTNPEARQWMRTVIREEMINNAGCAGWMVDFAEALPFEAHLHDGTPADVYHNQYPVDWMKLNRTAIREAGLTGQILTFNRAGFTQTPGHSVMAWAGDQLTTWDRYDGFQSAIKGLINGGLSGITLNHSDIGGYTSITQLGDEYARDKHLFMRWTEMSAFTSLMRTHEGNQPTVNVQVYSGNEVMSHFGRMTKVYTSLSSYRRTLFEEAETLGYPVVRHMWLHYSDDDVVFEHELQFLLGSDILFAPHLERCLLPLCTFEQEVYLPSDSWTHLWTGEEYTGGFVTIEAPLGYPAVFYRSESEAMPDVLTLMRQQGLDVHP